MVSYTPMPMTAMVEAHLIINIVLVVVTVLVVGLRVLSRILARSRLGMDDYLTIFSVPQGIAMLILQAFRKSLAPGRARLGFVGSSAKAAVQWQDPVLVTSSHRLLEIGYS